MTPENVAVVVAVVAAVAAVAAVALLLCCLAWQCGAAALLFFLFFLRALPGCCVRAAYTRGCTHEPLRGEAAAMGVAAMEELVDVDVSMWRCGDVEMCTRCSRRSAVAIYFCAFPLER
eukprot:TRINITY_DN575_c1_g3_i1.p3 TRINITY_DN575_c1_g3~~TRINITY_DN575_c1_g3_i1.p3  ORF type:complete len:118 (-),score=26.98 TRINITY_DN575_c1_g3_i1:211-564(-)